MLLRLKAKQDSFISEKYDDQNFGYDQTLSLYNQTTDAQDIGRILIQFDRELLDEYISTYGLDIATSTTSELRIYDTSNILSDKNKYKEANKFMGASAEIGLLDSEFAEGNGINSSDTDPVRAYVTWTQRSDGNNWTNPGGDYHLPFAGLTWGSNITFQALSGVTFAGETTEFYTFDGMFDGIVVDADVILNRMISSADDHGIIVKLLDGIESQSDIEFYKKDFLSRHTTYKAYQPEIIVVFYNRLISEESSYELGRLNTFVIETLDNNLSYESITAITEIRLMGYNPTLSANEIIDSQTGTIVYSTYKTGIYSFNFSLTSSLGTYTNPYIEVDYDTATESKTKTLTLSNDKLFTTSEFLNFRNGNAIITLSNDYKPIYKENEGIQTINIRANYTEISNRFQNYRFESDDDSRILKNLEYRIYDEFDKEILDWEYTNYDNLQNSIVFDTRCLDTNYTYYIDFRIGDKLYIKEIEFRIDD